MSDLDLTRLVKPLVWEYHTFGSMAYSGVGLVYIIDTRNKNNRVSFIKGLYPSPEFSDLEAAQAAANADNAARVLAPIDTALIEELVEAATEVGRISDRDHVAWHRLAAALAKMNGGA